MNIKLGGKDFTLGSDAHIPENMTSGLIEGTELLLSKGIKTLNYYKDRKKITYDTEGVIK